MEQTNNKNIKVHSLDVSDSRQIRSILYNSYRHEPTFKYIFDIKKPGYKQRVRATLRESIRLHFEAGQPAIGLLCNGRLVGVALIGAPGLRLELANQFKWKLRMILTTGFSCTRRYIDYNQQIINSLPESNYHMLPLMAVHPEFQGQGIGRMLMSEVHHQCDADSESTGVALDTGNERYLEFYGSLGYEPLKEVTIGNVIETILFKPSHKGQQAA